MAEIITIPDLENGKVDIDTLADIVNLQEPTTETRLSGPVNTWFGVQASITSASGLVYTTKSAMDAAPGTVSGQAARVTDDGGNTGLYIWSGSEWVKTRDPLTNFDSLTINRGKDYPMVAVERGGTAPSDVALPWIAGLLGIRLEGTQPGIVYRLGYYGNGILVGGVANYGVSIYKMPESDLTNQTLLVDYTTSPEFKFDRSSGDVQVRSALLPENIRLTLVVDTDELPDDGTPVVSANPTHNGYNSIISPDCYFIKDAIQSTEDSLTINAGKDFPFMVVARGGTAPSDVHPVFKDSIVESDVFKAREDYSYRVGYYGNGVETTIGGVSGKRYGFSIYRIPNDRMAEGYQELINSFDKGPQFIPDRVKGGIQNFEFSCESEPATRISISLDVDKLPPDGTQVNSSAATHNGFNSIIHPANYQVDEFNEFIEGECLVDWDVSTQKLIVAYKSNSKWYNVRFQRKSVNNTFTILGFGYDEAYAPVLNNILPVESIALSSRTEASSDWIAPMTFQINEGGDPGTVPLYTGGSHGTNNTTGDPTSEMKLCNIYVDGTILDQTRNYHKTCKFVDVLTQQDVQAWNTTVSKRPAAEEYVSFHITPKGTFVHKKLKALYDLTFTADNGCQVYMAGMTPLTVNSYLFWGGNQTSRSNIQDGVNFNSGPKSSYPEVYGVSVRHPNAGEFSAWVDPKFGIGDRAALSDSEPLFLFEGGKIYPKLATISSPFTVLAGETYEWRGGYYWGMPTNTANFDTVQQVQDGTIAVKPNGRYVAAGEMNQDRDYVDTQLQIIRDEFISEADGATLIAAAEYTDAVDGALRDDLGSIDSGKGAALIGYKHRTQADRNMDFISVRDFITTLIDGTTSNQSGIEGAVAYCLANDEVLYWPRGTYVSTGTIPGLHQVEHVGKGVIKRGSNTFFPDPTRKRTNTLYVSTTGNDENDGLTSALPFQSISAAISSALEFRTVSNPWVINISDGVYNERLVLPDYSIKSSDFFHIQGTPKATVVTTPTVILDGAGVTGSDVVIRCGFGNKVRISNILFRNWSSAWDCIQASTGTYAWLYNCQSLDGTPRSLAVADRGAAMLVQGGGKIGGQMGFDCYAGSTLTVGYNATSIANGTFIRNTTYAGFYLKSSVHCVSNYGDYTDNDTVVLGYTNSRFDTKGDNFKRNTDVGIMKSSMVSENLSPASEYNYGTPDANTRVWTYSQYSSADIYHGGSSGGLDVAHQRVSTVLTGPVTDTFARRLKTIQAYSLVTPGKYAEVDCMISAAGSASTKTARLKLGGVTLATYTIPAGSQSGKIKIQIWALNSTSCIVISEPHETWTRVNAMRTTSVVPHNTDQELAWYFSAPGDGDTVTLQESRCILWG